MACGAEGEAMLAQYDAFSRLGLTGDLFLGIQSLTKLILNRFTDYGRDVAAYVYLFLRKRYCVCFI